MHICVHATIRFLYFKGLRSVVPVESFDNSTRTWTRIHPRMHAHMHTRIVGSGHLTRGTGVRDSDRSWFRSPHRLRPLRAMLNQRTNERLGTRWVLVLRRLHNWAWHIEFAFLRSFPFVHSSILSLAYSDQHIDTPMHDRLMVELFTLAVSYR